MDNPELQVRFHWEPNSVALWDNRVCSDFVLTILAGIPHLMTALDQVVTHAATYDFWPATRHALRAAPRSEKPMSVTEYESRIGKSAMDRQLEIWMQQGLDPNWTKQNDARLSL